MRATKRSAPAAVFFFCVIVLISVSLAAQQAAAPVVITVADPSGAGIPHATLRVVPAPDLTPKMETNDKGQLALDLKPGGYALFVQSPGFKSLTTHFEVREGREVQTVPAVLQVGSYSGPTTVSPATSKDDLALYAYPYHEPTALSPSQFKAMPHVTVTFHNSHTNADEIYSGVRVADLLTPLGAPLGSELRGVALTSYLVATGADGYKSVLALAEVDPSFHPGEILVADTMNGKPLDAHSGPFELVVTEDKRPARSVRNLISIELRTLP